MKRINAIVKREWASYFKSPIGYIVLAITIFIMSLMAIMFGAFSSTYSDVGGILLSCQLVLFLLVIPLITMRSFSEDRKNGSEILLLTSPASVYEIVIGKYLAAFYLLLSMTAMSIIFLILTLAFGGTIDAKVLGAYIAFICLGAAYLAIGIFASSLTENQFISAIITFVILIGFMLINVIASACGSLASTLVSKINLFGLTDLQIDGVKTAVTSFIEWPNPTSRLDNFNSGIFEIAPLVFFVSLIAIFLFLTIRVIEKRRWTQK